MKIPYTDFENSWKALHGGAKTTGVVGVWLRVSYRIAAMGNRIRVSPIQVTYLGVFFGILSAVFSPSGWCALFITLSLACDGVDGSIAILSNRTSKMGSLIDSTADRIVELLWFISISRFGVAFEFVFAGWLLGSFQEYARAKLISVGVKEIGIVTVAERPIRAIIIILAVLAWLFGLSHFWLNALIGVLVAVQSIGFLQVLSYAYKSLK